MNGLGSDWIRRTALAASLAAVLPWPSSVRGGEHAPAPVAPRVVIEYFFEPGCEECERGNTEILPELERRYAGYFVLTSLDVGVETNYIRLIAYQEGAGAKANAHVSMVLDGSRVLNGRRGIHAPEECQALRLPGDG